MSSNAVNRRQFLAAFAALAVPPTGPLPPVSWTCPMHPEVVDDQSGACPICRMALTPVRLELVWSCQLHLDVDRKSTRLNSSHRCISYAVFCLKKKKKRHTTQRRTE